MTILIYSIIMLLVSCSTERQPGELYGPSEVGTYVIDAILVVDKSMPSVFIHETAAPDEAYNQKDVAISNAQIIISWNEKNIEYQADLDTIGRYNPPSNAPIILPNTKYIFQAYFEDGSFLTATTTTPQRLQVQKLVLLDDKDLSIQKELELFRQSGYSPFDAKENQIIYREGILEAVLDPIDAPAYQLAIFNLEIDSSLLLEADFLDEEDLKDLDRSGSSPALSIRDGRARLPWFAVIFEGRHLFRIYAIDKNWFDFIRTDPDANRDQGGGLLGEQFQRPLFNIEGGIGLFASASVDSVGFSVSPVPE